MGANRPSTPDKGCRGIAGQPGKDLEGFGPQGGIGIGMVGPEKLS
jgi:hypothetical protein